MPEVRGPAGRVHCWLGLGLLALPVLFGVAWQTEATARAPFVVPVSASQRPSLRFFSTAFEPSCQRCAPAHDFSVSPAGAVDVTVAADRHVRLMRTVPSAAIVQCWLAAVLHVSMAMSVDDNAARHLPSLWSRMCPAGPLPLAGLTVQENDPVASWAPALSVTLTWTVGVPDRAGQPETRPQLFIARPPGSPVAVTRSVHPASPSATGVECHTGAPTEPVSAPRAPSVTFPWTSHLNVRVALGSPVADAVTDTGNGAAVPGSCPLIAPVLASI